MELQRISGKHKNNKLLYYLKNYSRLLLPDAYYQKRLINKLKSIPKKEQEEILKRVNYYNKLEEKVDLLKDTPKLSSLKLKDGKTYFFDFREYTRYFKKHLKCFFLFGDIVEVPSQPSFVKSRPIHLSNENSILLKWNKIRHFLFIKNDSKTFLEKKNMLVSRGKVHPTQPQRIKFLEKYFNHPLCNIGKVNNNELNSKWLVERMGIQQQLAYKFILCIEGNDVATNLKWVMSSNSIAVMPQPKFETWFMEAQLIPDYHYICLADDYSNMEEKLTYYIEHPEKALAIMENAHRFIDQFKNKNKEDLISLLVLKKYFEKTNQI